MRHCNGRCRSFFYLPTLWFHCSIVIWEYLVQSFWLWCGLWSGLVPEHYTKMSWLGNSWSSKVAKWNARKSQSNRSVSGQTFPQYWLETPKYMLHHRSHCLWNEGLVFRFENEYRTSLNLDKNVEFAFHCQRKMSGLSFSCVVVINPNGQNPKW